VLEYLCSAYSDLESCELRVAVLAGDEGALEPAEDDRLPRVNLQPVRLLRLGELT